MMSVVYTLYADWRIIQWDKRLSFPSFLCSCSSYVGRTGGVQPITLQGPTLRGPGCWTRGIVAHEIGKFPISTAPNKTCVDFDRFFDL